MVGEDYDLEDVELVARELWVDAWGEAWTSQERRKFGKTYFAQAEACLKALVAAGWRKEVEDDR